MSDGPLLTDRQREVLVLIAEGHTGEAIARRLGLGVTTVRQHIYAMYAALEARTAAQAVDHAWRWGILGGAGDRMPAAVDLVSARDAARAVAAALDVEIMRREYDSK